MKTPASPYLRIFRRTTVSILCLAALFYGWRTIHWAWQWDSSIMHYVNFLMDHGKAPYRDIIDMNMPGSYLMEGWAMHIFGTGDLGWRIYEFFLLGVLIASMIVIAQPYDWLAGFIAGVMFTLIHGAEKPQNAVERDEVMTVLIAAGIACLFVAVRKHSAALMLPFGLLLGMAATMKPTAAPLGIALLTLAWFQLRRERTPAPSYIGFSLAGLAVAALIIAHFFWQHHVVHDFLEISRRLLPFYTGVSNRSIGSLVADLAPRRAFYPLLAVTLILTLRHDWKDWERQALIAAIVFGAISFIVQRKGFLYHRYPLTAFLLLWMALEFCLAMKALDWRRWLGIAGVAGFLLLVPRYCRSIAQPEPKALLPDALADDLTRLGGTKLQNQVECMDMVAGCLQALFRLGLVQNMGYMGDYMFFAMPGSQPSPYYRNRFLEQARRNPPSVIVVTTAWMSGPDSFDKVNQWPEFIALLERDYTLVTARICDPANSRGYKIYVLRPQ